MFKKFNSKRFVSKVLAVALSGSTYNSPLSFN